jgi:CMP-N,N'-diacetyllegionaminic acid synthase
VSHRVVALIPARGGSKGIPRKNVLPIAGKPLIAWSIRQGLEAARVDRVIVSTDDPEIARVALEYGAEVPFLRPAEYAHDLAPDVDVFAHALRFLLEAEGYAPHAVVHLRPTGPVRRTADIDLAVDLLLAHPEADSVRSVSLVHQSPYKMWSRRDDGRIEPLLRLPGVVDCQSRPRQSLPAAYWQNGYVDVLRPRVVIEGGSMCGEHVLPFLVETTLFDLDYPEDVAPVEEALLQLQAGSTPDAIDRHRHPV